MRHERLRSRDEERYLDAVDEARAHVRFTRREYMDALDELSDLEEMAVGPEGPEADDPRDEDYYEPRRRRQVR